MTNRKILLCLTILTLALAAGVFWILWEQREVELQHGGTLVQTVTDQGVPL